MRKVNQILRAIPMMVVMLMACGESSTERKLPSSQIETIEVVTIGSQVWMAENLNVDKFRNGDPIPHVKSAEEWEKAGDRRQPAWCFYNNDPANGEKYGKLYNWYAVSDPRGLAPEGWHVSSDDEWNQLSEYLGIEAPRKMKSNNGWENDGNGTNSSGFSVLPGGMRESYDFIWIGGIGFWWTSTEDNLERPIVRSLGALDGVEVYTRSAYKEEGYSVCCIRN